MGGNYQRLLSDCVDSGDLEGALELLLQWSNETRVAWDRYMEQRALQREWFAKVMDAIDIREGRTTNAPVL